MLYFPVTASRSAEKIEARASAAVVHVGCLPSFCKLLDSVKSSEESKNSDSMSSELEGIELDEEF